MQKTRRINLGKFCDYAVNIWTILFPPLLGVFLYLLYPALAHDNAPDDPNLWRLIFVGETHLAFRYHSDHAFVMFVFNSLYYAFAFSFLLYALFAACYCIYIDKNQDDIFLAIKRVKASKRKEIENRDVYLLVSSGFLLGLAGCVILLLMSFGVVDLQFVIRYSFTHNLLLYVIIKLAIFNVVCFFLFRSVMFLVGFAYIQLRYPLKLRESISKFKD